MSMDEFLKVDFWEMILRTTLSFTALLILTRILGKKQLSQLTFFHYVTGITFGSIAADMAGQTDVPFLDGLIAISWWTILTLILSFVAMKWGMGRVILDGQPTIIIKEGEIMEKAMKKSRLHMDDIMMMLREKFIYEIKDVHYAIMETNGKLSVLKKVEYQESTKQDAKVPIIPPKYLPSEIIVNGKIIEKNFVELGLTEDWLMKKLRKKEIDSVENVFFAQVLSDGSLFIDLKKKKD